MRNIPMKMKAPKHAGRKSHIHRVTMEKGANGGYTLEAHKRFSDSKGANSPWDGPPPEMHAFSSYKDAHDALPQMFGEAHPSTKPAKGDDIELPE